MRILESSGPKLKLVDLSLCGSFALPKSLLSVSTMRSSGRGASHLYARTSRHPTTTKRQKKRRNADRIGDGWGRQTHRKAVASIHRMAVVMVAVGNPTNRVDTPENAVERHPSPVAHQLKALEHREPRRLGSWFL